MLTENIQNGKGWGKQNILLRSFCFPPGSPIPSVSPMCKSCQFQQVALTSTQILWPKSKSRHWLPSFAHDLTSQLRPQTEDMGEQTQAIPTLPCLNSSSTECLSMVRWSSFCDAMLASGRWPERILSHSSILHPSTSSTSSELCFPRSIPFRLYSLSTPPS